MLNQAPPPAEDRSAPAIRGLSLPSRSGEDSRPDEETALPDWLRELSEESEELFEAEGEGIPSPSSDEPVIEEETLPDWLRGETLGETSGTQGPSAPEEDLDWLSGLLEESSSRPEEETSAGEALPEWLSGTLEDTATPGGASQQEEAVPAPEGEQPAEDMLPEWLSSVFGEAPPAETAPTSEEPLPEWLAGASEEPEESPGGEQAPVVEEELPEWLQGFQDADTMAAPDLSDEETPPVPLEPVSQRPEAETLNWLAEPGESASGAAPEAAPAEEPPPETTPSPEQGAGSLPAAEGGQPEEPSPVAAGPTVFGEAEAPDWLADLEQVTSPEPETTPAEVAAPPEPPGPAGPSQPQAEPLTGEDLPDWVKALAESEQAEPSPLEGTEAVAPQPQEPTPVFTMEDLAEEGSTSAPQEAEALPEWLQDLGETGATGEPATTGATPPAAQLPTWLKEIMPSDVAMEYTQAGGALLVPEGEDLYQAEMPPWLEELRGEETTPQTRARAPVSRGPSELEGPLEGLRGTLPGPSLVDAPAEPSLSMSRLTISEAAIAQAQLWQRLLERPSSARQAVASVLTPQPRATRGLKLLVALVLMLSIVLGMSQMPQALMPQPGPTTASGVPAMAQAVTGLQPGATVILITDFEAGYTDEISLMAHPLLTQMAQREVTVIQASTLPQGLGLGAALMRDAHLKYSPQSPCYLPGNANGIAEFLTRAEVNEAAHLFLLTSQPQRLRWWVEQRQATGREDIPMSVLLTASAAPMAQPYLQAGAVDGWMVGVTQLPALYHELTGGDQQVQIPRADTLRLTQGAAAALLLLGALAAFTSRRKGAG